MFKWVKNYPKTLMDIARFLAMVAVLASFIFLLHQISDQNKSRSNNLDKLISDNAQQTQVLCTLILSSKIDTTSISSKDLNRIENICKQRIKTSQATAAISTTNTSETSDSSLTDTLSTTTPAPGNTSLNTNNQPSNQNQATPPTTSQSPTPASEPILNVAPVIQPIFDGVKQLTGGLIIL